MQRTYKRNYYKCRAYGVSATESTDWNVSNIACGLFDKPLSPLHTPVGEQLKHAGKREPDKPIAGQIDMFGSAEE